MAYMNIRKMTTLYNKDTIRELEVRARSLQESNARLKSEYASNEKETNSIVQHFQTQISEHNVEVLRLRAELKAFGTKEDRDARFAETKQQYEENVKVSHEKGKKRKSDLRSRLESAQDELRILRKFAQDREMLGGELDKLNKKLRTLNMRHQKKIEALGIRFEGERERLQADHDRKVREIGNNSTAEAEKTLDRKTRITTGSNEKMAAELKLQLDASAEMKKEIMALIQENEFLEKELHHHTEQKNSLAQRGFAKSQQLTEKAQVVRNLERSLQDIIDEFEADKERSKEEYGSQTQKLKTDISTKRQFVKMNIKEIHSIQKLVRTITENRSEMERHFLRALKHIKDIKTREMYEQWQKDRSEFVMKASIVEHRQKTGFPKIAVYVPGSRSKRSTRRRRPSGTVTGGASMTNAGTASGSRLRRSGGGGSTKKPEPPKESRPASLTDLDWDDRERVLKCLFSHINKARMRTALREKEDQKTFMTSESQDDWSNWPKSEAEKFGSVLDTQLERFESVSDRNTSQPDGHTAMPDMT